MWKTNHECRNSHTCVIRSRYRPISSATRVESTRHAVQVDRRQEFSPQLGAALNKCEQTHYAIMHEMFAHSRLVCTAKVHDGHV